MRATQQPPEEQADLFGGTASANARIVRPAVPAPQLLQPGDDYESAGARFAPPNRIAEPDKLSRSRIAALVKCGLSSGRDVYVMAANNAEGAAPLTLFELATAIAP